MIFGPRWTAPSLRAGRSSHRRRTSRGPPEPNLVDNPPRRFDRTLRAASQTDDHPSTSPCYAAVSSGVRQQPKELTDREVLALRVQKSSNCSRDRRKNVLVADTKRRSSEETRGNACGAPRRTSVSPGRPTETGPCPAVCNPSILLGTDAIQYRRPQAQVAACPAQRARSPMHAGPHRRGPRRA